jgi:GH25 family lysozyme M1 (1,4-beta-N-acetylmuramidase)
MSKFYSQPDDCSIHDSGWIEIAGGFEITKLPVWDTKAQLFARCGHEPAEHVARRLHTRLPLVDEYDQQCRLSMHIDPYTMPTAEMLEEVGIPIYNQAAIDQYRNHNMMTRQWCEMHDQEVLSRMNEAGWSGQPVFNAGKHWVRGGIIYGWKKSNGDMIQPPSTFHKPDPRYVDYATTFHVVRRKTTKVIPAKKNYSGVDISHHQKPGNIDYDKMAAEHDFLIARASYGVRRDKTFEEHFKKAKEAGMIVGGYHFFRQQQDWQKQLKTFLGELTSVGLGPGDILPVVDLEENQKYDGPLSPDHHNEYGRKLIEKLKEEYGDVYVYLAPHYYVNIGKPEWLLEYPWWIAHYTSKDAPTCPWKQWDIWQYTGKGTSPAYRGQAIDLNRALTIRTIPGIL